MNEFIFEMLIVGIVCTVVDVVCGWYLVHQRIYGHETFYRLSLGSYVVVIGMIGLTIFMIIFEVIWFMMYLGVEV